MKLILLFTLLYSALFAAPKVKTGIDVLIESKFAALKGKRCGLITNQTGVTGSLETTLDAFRKSKEVKLVAVFAPEHGIDGAARAGETVPNSVDTSRGLTIYSLYAGVRKPTKDMMKNIEVLVYDLQDVGTRSYTYISTMGLAMEAAAEANIPFYILDRPNPISGEAMSGTTLDQSFASFVGMYPIPYVYGLTCGELAQMIAGEGWIKKKPALTVIKMKGWARAMRYDETGLAWVPPSPNIPHAGTAAMYAATGILGEFNLCSIGIGGTLPFEIIVAPWIDGEKFSNALEKYSLRGVAFRPMKTIPANGFYKDQETAGVQIVITDAATAELAAVTPVAIEVLKKLYPWRVSLDSLTEASRVMIDKTSGSDFLRVNASRKRFVREWRIVADADAVKFREKRKKYLLY